MKRAIVTGANGFVGSAVVNALVHHGYEVYAIGHNDHFQRIKADTKIHCISCDLTEISTLQEKLPRQNYDLFYHFAWTGSSGPQRGDNRLQMRNVLGSVEAVEAAAALGCRRFIGAGSIMEYEAYEVRHQPEVAGIGNVYGSSKLAAHIMGLVKAKELGIDFIWGIITNIYGPGEMSPRLVNMTIKNCLQGIAPKFTSGIQNYDFVYIDDAACAFRMIGEKGQAFQEYVIGSSHAKQLREFLLDMRKAVAPDLPFQFGEMPFAGISLSLEYFDCTKTEKDTGFKAQTSFAEGCEKTAAWWKQQLQDIN